MVFQVDASAGQSRFNAPDSLATLVDADLRFPLKRGMGFRHKCPHAHIDLATATATLVALFLAFIASSVMASMSSTVSVGRPIIK